MMVIPRKEIVEKEEEFSSTMLSCTHAICETIVLFFLSLSLSRRKFALYPESILFAICSNQDVFLAAPVCFPNTTCFRAIWMSLG